MAVVETRTLTTGYAHHNVSVNLNLALPEGELVCLLGPNGAGKSTLLRTLTGMQRPLAGQVLIQGKDIHGISSRDLARLLAVVLTDRISVGLLSGYDLVALGRHPYTGWSGKLSAEDHSIVRQSIFAVGAEDLAARPVSELSDGERQRIMIARALAQQPRLLVLDEVTAFLDLPRRVSLMRLLLTLAHERGVCILLSTHDLELALRTADRIWLMGKEGTFHQGAPEDLALGGAFGEVFASEGVHFDLGSGHFQLHEVLRFKAHITGDGMARVWTERALSRAGYAIVAEPHQADRVICCRAGNRWDVSGQVADSVEALVRLCR